MKKYRLILASGSPRRQELLSKLGIDYTVRLKNDIKESYPWNSWLLAGVNRTKINIFTTARYEIILSLRKTSFHDFARMYPTTMKKNIAPNHV